MRPITELVIAINSLKCRKAAYIDNIYPEFFKHFGAKFQKWLIDLYNDIMVNHKLTKLSRKAKL